MRPEDSVVARRYAKALMALSRESLSEERVLNGLREFGAALKQVPLLETLLTSPVLTRPAKLELLRKLTPAMGLHPTCVKFLELLVQHGRMHVLTSATESFQSLIDVAAGRVRAVVTTPVVLPPQSFQAVVGGLTALFGKQVLAEARVDETLLGGVVARVGNVLIDSSIKGRLAQVRRFADSLATE